MAASLRYPVKVAFETRGMSGVSKYIYLQLFSDKIVWNNFENQGIYAGVDNWERRRDNLRIKACNAGVGNWERRRVNFPLANAK